MTTNIIPSTYASGKFEAAAPFDRVVNPETFYTVEAIRTIPEMQGLNINIYSRVFKPVGVEETSYQQFIDEAVSRSAVVISLIPRTGPPVYVLSNYLKSFPLVDGWSYERMCLVADLGALPIDMKEALAQAQEHFKQYIIAHYGIEANVQLGTVPVIGYTSQFEHETMERVRKNKITDTGNDVATINSLETQLAASHAYVKELEARLGVVAP